MLRQQVASSKGLSVGALHLLGQALRGFLDDTPGRLDHAGTAAKVSIEGDLPDARIALGKREDIVNVAAPPLVDGLIDWRNGPLLMSHFLPGLN